MTPRALPLIALLLIAAAPRADEPAPRLFLWAWERPERLEFIDPATTGVAALMGTARLYGDTVAFRPRLQPLLFPPGTHAIAVVRIESDAHRPPSLSAQMRRALVGQLRAVVREPFADLQIDFDALASERAFYRELLADVRAALPIGTRLSITALASWCLQDGWVTGLPIDAAVPMLFRMGADRAAVWRHFESGRDFAPALCRSAHGLAADEPPRAQLPPGRQLFVFNPRPWSAAEAARVLKEWSR